MSFLILFAAYSFRTYWSLSERTLHYQELAELPWSWRETSPHWQVLWYRWSSCL